MQNILSAEEVFNKSKEFEVNNRTKTKQEKEESQRKYKVFLESSDGVFKAINKRINFALTQGRTSVSCLIIPTCFTTAIFEKILKYHLEKNGYDVETEVIYPRAQSIETSIDTSAVAINISWAKNKEDKFKDVQNKVLQLGNVGDISDGYHTFNELYHHRAVLFSLICNQNKKVAWKSLLHSNPDDKMYDGMFIVGIDTPFGQVTYHYDIDPYWDMFKVKELDRAPEWDGHTSQDAIERLQKWSEAIKDSSVPFIQGKEKI